MIRILVIFTADTNWSSFDLLVRYPTMLIATVFITDVLAIAPMIILTIILCDKFAFVFIFVGAFIIRDSIVTSFVGLTFSLILDDFVAFSLLEFRTRIRVVSPWQLRQLDLFLGTKSMVLLLQRGQGEQEL